MAADATTACAQEPTSCVRRESGRGRLRAPILLAALCCLLLVCAGDACAQGTTNYPASLDNATTLPQAVDQKATYLTAAASNSATSLTVHSTAGVPASGVLQVDSELMAYAAADATHFTVTRGFSGTAAAAHAANATVRFPLVSAHVNGLRGSIFALEAKLGTGASDASSAPAGHVLTKQAGGTTGWAAPASGGEANTASNVGAAGVGLFKQKSGVDLQFKKLNAGSSKVTVTDDTANSEVDLDVNQANLDRNALGGGALTVANGGTGATTAAGARTSLELGTAATRNVPASGNAASGEVVKGDDTRLSDARTPTSHTHAAADTTSGTFSAARLGSGTADSTKYLRGDSTWATTPADNSASTSVLGANFSLTGADGVYQDTGLSVTLPSSGTYLVFADIRYSIDVSGGYGFMLAKLRNTTDGADVANSERELVFTEDVDAREGTAALHMTVTVAAAKTIKLYASRTKAAGASWVTSDIPSSANGRTVLTYLRVN